MPVTVKDIALAAGVSKAAVSKVLHNASTSVRVSEERARQIRQLAKEMGYVPNANARILRQSRTNTIGVYFENLAGIAAGPLYTMHLLDGICKEVFKRHYRVALLAEMDDTGTYHSLADGRLDGVIWSKVVRDERTQRVIEECPIPIVTLNRPPHETSNAMVVRCDSEGGIDAAVAHLFGLGHRRILFMYEATEGGNSDCVDRLEAFRKAMTVRELAVGEADIAAWTWELEEFPAWWAGRPPHTAVIAWSESCAGRLLRQCAAHGVHVPGDLSVIGFDSTQFCDTTKPNLTAVRQPISEMAELAARLLLDTLDGKKPEQRCYQLPCPLDIRESTGPANAR